MSSALYSREHKKVVGLREALEKIAALDPNGYLHEAQHIAAVALATDFTAKGESA